MHIPVILDHILRTSSDYVINIIVHKFWVANWIGALGMVESDGMELLSHLVA